MIHMTELHHFTTFTIFGTETFFNSQLM